MSLLGLPASSFSHLLDKADPTPPAQRAKSEGEWLPSPPTIPQRNVGQQHRDHHGRTPERPSMLLQNPIKYYRMVNFRAIPKVRLYIIYMVILGLQRRQIIRLRHQYIYFRTCPISKTSIWSYITQAPSQISSFSIVRFLWDGARVNWTCNA